MERLDSSKCVRVIVAFEFLQAARGRTATIEMYFSALNCTLTRTPFSYCRSDRRRVGARGVRSLPGEISADVRAARRWRRRRGGRGRLERRGRAGGASSGRQ